jgi:hypothetical protein
MIVHNSMSLKLVQCTVVFDSEKRRFDTTVSFFPIVAFESLESGSFAPQLVSGKVIGWGEVRASAVGASVYGVCASTPEGVTTADQCYPTIDGFVQHSELLIALAVDRVREELGHKPMRFAADLVELKSQRSQEGAKGSNERH